jgi:ribonuclease HI
MPEWVHTLTVDFSYDAASGVIGVGIVVQSRGARSGRGPIIDRIAEAHMGVSPAVGEMFAVLRAVETAKDRGFSRVKLRSDYNSMRSELRERFRSGGAGKTDLQQKIFDLARQFEWIDFGYVPRRKNQIAHALSRRGRLMLPGSNQRATNSAGAEQALAADSP